MWYRIYILVHELRLIDSLRKKMSIFDSFIGRGSCSHITYYFCYNIIRIYLRRNFFFSHCAEKIKIQVDIVICALASHEFGIKRGRYWGEFPSIFPWAMFMTMFGSACEVTQLGLRGRGEWLCVGAAPFFTP